jgi:hypothetical protein
MALADIFKTIGNGLSEEISEFKSIIGRIRLTSDTSAIGANFRKFGPSFGTYDFDAFLVKAKEFHAQAINSKDPLYNIVDAGNNRIAIDYNCELRGIFTHKGKPLAFFRFDYSQFGYRSKSDALEDFKRGKDIPFS